MSGVPDSAALPGNPHAPAGKIVEGSRRVATATFHYLARRLRSSRGAAR